MVGALADFWFKGERYLYTHKYRERCLKTQKRKEGGNLVGPNQPLRNITRWCCVANLISAVGFEHD